MGTALRGGGSLRPRVRRGHRGGRDGPQVGRAWGRARLGLCEVLKARRAGQPQVGGAVALCLTRRSGEVQAAPTPRRAGVWVGQRACPAVQRLERISLLCQNRAWCDPGGAVCGP